MEEDDLAPRKEADAFQPRKLAGMSLEALNEYIGELEAEIGRAREMIAEKEKARDAADSVFRL